MRDMGIEEARRALGDIVDRARLLAEPTGITRQGKPAAVIVPVTWYERVGSLVADIGEWLVPAMEDLDRLVEWQAKANSVRIDVPVDDLGG